MTDTQGAYANDWFHFDFVLGLGSNLLPCVPAGPDVRCVPGSALEGKVGKIPSQYNAAGLAHGLTEWNKRPILSNEVAIWSKDPRLNICVRTGPISGVYAFDVDIDNPNSDAVFNVLETNIPGMPVRARKNSWKFLVPFRLENGSCKKRKIKLDDKPRGPAIELLADGQQFVAAGSHSSGERYQWEPGLPATLPVLSLEQLEAVWATLRQRFAKDPQPAVPITTPMPEAGEPSTLTEIDETAWLDLRAALRFMLDKVQDNDTWTSIGYALLSLQRTRPAEQLWLEFSRKAVGYEEGAPETWWKAHARQAPRSDYRHIFTLAREAGWGKTSSPEAFQPVVPHVAGAAEDGDQGESVPVSGPDGSGGTDVPVSGPDGSGGADAAGIDVVPPLLPAKPVVRLVDANFSEIVSQLERIIEPHVYTQGAHLIRPSEAHTVESIRRDSDALMLIEATNSWAKVCLGKLATFERYATGKNARWYEVEPSHSHINTLMELGGWTTLRPLDAIARAPFVREDGSICDIPGYDPRSRALYIPNMEFPSIPGSPSLSDARSALDRLRNVFDQFPWKEPASESAFLAHILSEAGRLAVDRCPMFWYTAPSAGTGKGLLSEMASTIVHGTEPALRPWVSNSDELRKTLFASLLAGDRSIAFDNVPTGFKARAPELCAFITAATWKDRKLGVSETHAVSNKAVVSATGNNITPVSDLARRSLVVRLDANTERLKERRFKIEDLRGYVMAGRAGLLVDALTIIKAYRATEGMPVPLPSFERWSRVAREPLIWLGLPDPCDTQNETDDETGSLDGVFALLVAQFGGNEFTGMDIARMAGGVSDANGELTHALMSSGCSEPNSPQKIGYWLRGERDKISNGWKLVHAGNIKSGVKWKFKRIEELT